jgi:uncharacterized membrane protein YdjX (TVP38/TMEM64 family)
VGVQPVPPSKAKKRLGIIIAILIFISILAILYPFITNPTSVTSAYDSAGVFAPIVFILLVMIAPTPGAVVGVSGGAYFGIWHGAFYLFIGNLLGVCLTFFLVQKFGLPAAERFFKKEKLAQYERFAAKHPYLPWFVYAIPVFPIELMTFVIALSKKPFKQFFLTVVTALPFYALLVTTIGYKLYFFGEFQKIFEYASIAILVVMVYAILHFLYAWKKEEIHNTGRRITRGVARGVGEITDATEKITRAALKMPKSPRKKR